MGTGGSEEGGVVGAARLLGGAGALCPGEEENFEYILDNQEFLLVLFGDTEPAFGRLPFTVIVFSVEALRE